MFGLRRGIKKILNILTTIMAFLTIFLIAFLYAHAVFKFNLDADLLQTLYIIKEYAVLAVVVLVGLEFVITKGTVLTIIYCIIAAIVVAFSFFPEVALKLPEVTTKLLPMI